MSHLAAIRKYPQSRTRTVLAVVVLAWLNVVLQPCIMAMPQLADAANVVHSQFSSIPAQESISGDQHEMCPHCGTIGSCDQIGFANCDEFEAAKTKSSSKHLDGVDGTVTVVRSDPVHSEILQTRDACPLVIGIEFLPRQVPLTIANCVFRK